MRRRLVKMKMKMMLLALPLALGAMPLYAAALQTGVINREALEAPIQNSLSERLERVTEQRILMESIS